MSLITWDYLYNREASTFTGIPGGLDPIYFLAGSRKVDDFEKSSYATNASLQAVWSVDGGANLPTLGAGLLGAQNLQIIAVAATLATFRAFTNSQFGFVYPGRVSYPGTIVGIRFRATTSAAAGETINVLLRASTDATRFRKWNVNIGTATTVQYYVDFRRTADATGAGAWDETLINQVGFSGLINGSTYNFDQIEFIVEASIPDALYQIKANTDTLLGAGDIFGKTGPALASVGDSLTWYLELYEPGGVIIPVGGITPGNYQIDRLRAGVVTNIVASTAASSAAGRIFASYTPTAANWQVSDIILVTFSGGSIAIAEPSGTITTSLPNAFFYTRVQISDIAVNNPVLTKNTTASSNFNVAPVTIISLTPAGPSLIRGVSVSHAGFTAGAVMTYRVFKTTNGVLDQVLSFQRVVGTDPDGVIVLDDSDTIDGTGALNSWQLTAQSNNAGDIARTMRFQYTTQRIV